MSNQLTPSNSDDRKWGAIAHLAALIGLLLPLGLVLGPLLVWFLKRDDSEFVNAQGKSALNFQLSILAISFVLILLSTMIRPLLPLAFVTGIAGLAFAIMAGINVYKGKPFKYPWSLPLFK